jgi:hypothetical protein
LSHGHGIVLALGEHLHVDLLGRAAPVVRTPDGLRAVRKGNRGSPAPVEKISPPPAASTRWDTHQDGLALGQPLTLGTVSPRPGRS